MTPEEIQKILSGRLPGAQVQVEDMTGTSDHFLVEVAWSGFQGKNLMEQHQAVNRALSEPLQDGRIHALKIKTRPVRA